MQPKTTLSLPPQVEVHLKFGKPHPTTLLQQPQTVAHTTSSDCFHQHFLTRQLLHSTLAKLQFLSYACLIADETLEHSIWVCKCFSFVNSDICKLLLSVLYTSAFKRHNIATLDMSAPCFRFGAVTEHKGNVAQDYRSDMILYER